MIINHVMLESKHLENEQYKLQVGEGSRMNVSNISRFLQYTMGYD